MTTTTIAKRRNSTPQPPHDCARYRCESSIFEHSPGLTVWVTPETAHDYAIRILWTALADQSVTPDDAWATLRAAGL